MRPLPTAEEASALGATLRRVDPALLRPTPGSRRWYKGAEAYLEATVDGDDQGVVRFELYVRGRYARWTRGRGVETGSTDEPEVGEGMPMVAREARDGAPVAAVIEAVRAVIAGCPELADVASLI